MLLTLLLQAMPASPTPPPTVPEWLLHHAPLLSLSIACLMPFVLWALNRRTARLDKERAEEKAAFLAWQQRVDVELAKFMPQGDIKEELGKLGKQIGENQGAIKLLHDRGEEVNNGLNLRVGTLEQHNASLTLLPQQVQKLNTDHAVLANEVRTLAGNIEKLSQKQDGHFRDLMQAVERLAFTRGELHGGQRRDS